MSGITTGGRDLKLTLSSLPGNVHLASQIMWLTIGQPTGWETCCPYAAPHNAYQCRGEDSWCAIAVFNDEEWRNLCSVIGNPAWTEDPRFATLLSRKKNEKELDRLVEKQTIIYSAEEVMELMQAAGVAAGVYTIKISFK